MAKCMLLQQQVDRCQGEAFRRGLCIVRLQGVVCLGFTDLNSRLPTQSSTLYR